MLTLRKFSFYTGLLFSMILFVGACKSSGGSTGGGGTGGGGKDPGGDPAKELPKSNTVTDQKFVADQPEFPAADDDEFFQEPAKRGEVFRVLITEGNLSVRQVSGQKYIRRKQDPAGDKFQAELYRKYSERINFKDFVHTGELSVRLNPHNGGIEHLRFVPGKTPRSIQATIYFQKDLERFAFSFPRNSVSLREFKVRFEWRIKKKEGLSKEELRKKAIEYLRSQVKP